MLRGFTKFPEHILAIKFYLNVTEWEYKRQALKCMRHPGKSH